MNTPTLEAQNSKKEKYPLESILKSITERFELNFSYVDEVIKNKTARIPNKNLTLKKVLEFLKKETQLDFERLSETIIVIRETNSDLAKPKVLHLEEILIGNYLTKGITKLNNGSLTIKPRALGMLPGLIEPDVLQTIQAIPGVISIDETVSNINIRGGTHDQNLFLWDGIKMYQSGHFFGLISAFNPHTTERIDVYKNGSSAKFGGSVSSVIDMQLSDKITNTFSGEFGSNLINTDLFAKIPISNKTELQIAARRSITDVFNTPTYQQYFERIFQDSDFSQSKENGGLLSETERFYFYDITAKFLYNVSKKDKIRIHFLNVNNNFNYDKASQTNQIFKNKLNQENLAIGTTYSRNWTNNTSTNLQFYQSKYKLEANKFIVLNNLQTKQQNEIIDNSLKLDITHKINNNIKTNFGYQLNEIGVRNAVENINPIYRDNVKNVIQEHGLYAETQLLSNNVKTKLTIGGRLNYIEKFNKYIPEPRISFSQRFLNHFKFEILGEFKNQTTSQIIDLPSDFLGIEKRRWILANNEKKRTTINNKTIHPVPIIKSKQLSMGWHYKKKKLLVSVESYIKNVDGITTRSQGFQNQYQFVNAIGSYTSIGQDFLINNQFTDKINSWISYSYNINNYSFKSLNDNQAFPNNFDITKAVTIAGAYTNKNFKFSTGLNWHSGIPHTPPLDFEVPEGFTITYKEPNSNRINDYFRVDCSATYLMKISNKSKASFGVSLWNLLDTKNIINRYYTLNENKEIVTVNNKSLGLTPNLSVRFLF